MVKKILLVDDENDILEFLKYNLLKEGYKIFMANNGLKAIEIANIEKPDMIVLDIMMPKLNGIDTCKILRNIKDLKNTLIVFLTANATDETEIEGFEVGADDYITKPIRPKVFVKRINALFKRRRKEEKNGKYIFRNISIDMDKRRLTVNGKKIDNLPKKQFKILVLLASKPERVFSREEIYNRIWGTDIVVGDRTLDVHIRKLRVEIGKQYIKTSKGFGYAFIPD